MTTLSIKSSVAAVAVAFMLTGLAYAVSPGYGSETRSYNLAHGRVVFNDHCLSCHEAGKKGAPVVGELADWLGRIDRPLDHLINNAIQGHGDMPPRGDTDLTDQDVASAVAYVVDRARIVVADQLGALPPTGAGLAELEQDAVQSSNDNALVRMFLLLIGKERWK